MKPTPDNEEDKSKAKKNPHDKASDQPAKLTEEIGGPEGPEPTRYGDWEKKGRCVDF